MSALSLWDWDFPDVSYSSYNLVRELREMAKQKSRRPTKGQNPAPQDEAYGCEEMARALENLPQWQDWELKALCVFEYARESQAIREHYFSTAEAIGRPFSDHQQIDPDESDDAIWKRPRGHLENAWNRTWPLFFVTAQQSTRATLKVGTELKTPGVCAECGTRGKLRQSGKILCDACFWGFPTSLTYWAKIDGVQHLLPNPLIWAWSQAGGDLFEKAWREQPPEWRAAITLQTARVRGKPIGLVQDAGGDRAGFQRITLEINWANFKDAEIKTAISSLLQRPPDVPEPPEMRPASLHRNLKYLAMRRIRNAEKRFNLVGVGNHFRAYGQIESAVRSRNAGKAIEPDMHKAELARAFEPAWNRFKKQGDAEWRRSKQVVSAAFLELFPFFPASEKPLCCR